MRNADTEIVGDVLILFPTRSPCTDAQDFAFAQLGIAVVSASKCVLGAMSNPISGVLQLGSPPKIALPIM